MRMRIRVRRSGVSCRTIRAGPVVAVGSAGNLTVRSVGLLRAHHPLALLLLRCGETARAGVRLTHFESK